LDWDIVTIESGIVEPDYRKPVKFANFYFGNPRPNPDAPLPVEIPQNIYANA
jgi:hypothetical protein